MAAKVESFAELLEESLAKTNMRPGSVVRGKVMAVDKDFVVVNAGLKSDAVISADQFKNEQGDFEVIVGDEVDVAIDAIEDGNGETRLSREKAKRLEAWTNLIRMYEAGQTVLGTISGKVKGGFTVEIGAVRAFLPGSLVDVRPVRDSSFLEGKELEFKIIKIDQKRNNVVVSRRSVMESATSAERETLLSSLQEGQVVKGIVKNLTDYGAFIDLGGVDGLLHITDMAWKRVKHPSEVVAVGDEITVKILKFDRERTRVSLGLKQLAEDPWADIARRYPEGARLVGKVTNLTDYGCFVEIEPGVEGLVHVSEMDWTNKNIHPSKVVSVGDEVEVMVLDIDEERRRISLGVKQCKANPWEAFAATHQKNDRVRGKIKSITDFGIFIGLDGGIDGLIHLTDISWNVPGEEMIRNYKKGDELEAVVLAVDAERERISLGIKQLEQDPFNNFIATHNKNDMLKGKITSVDAKGAVIDLGEGVEGYLRASEISSDRVDDARNHLKVDEEIEARFVGIERKKRMINLSLKAKGAEDDFVDEPINTGSTTFGDILKEKMGQQNSDDE